MLFFWMALLSVGIVIADQWTKFLVLESIPLYGHVDALPGLFSLTYQQNTGGAWSLMKDMPWWFFGLIFLVLTAALVYEYFKKPLPFTRLERWFIAAIYGGGLGNIIDRARLGFVVDMIDLDFMNFPVFNVADCFITCGCIALIFHLVFYNKEFWKEEKT